VVKVAAPAAVPEGQPAIRDQYGAFRTGNRRLRTRSDQRAKSAAALCEQVEQFRTALAHQTVSGFRIRHQALAVIRWEFSGILKDHGVAIHLRRKYSRDGR